MNFTSQRILVFKAAYCQVCEEIEKAKLLEKFVDKQTVKLPITYLSCADEDGNAAPGSDHEKNFKLSDAYSVEGFPTIIFEGKRADGSGFEIARASAETVSAFSMRELTRVYKEGFAEISELPDDVLSQDEASKKIGW